MGVLRIFLMMVAFAFGWGWPACVADDVVRSGGADTPALEDVWQAILEEAGLKYELLNGPSEQKRRWFVDGRIILDCCVVPEWRARAVEQEIQMFSDVILAAREHYVFRTGESRPIASQGDMSKMVFAVTRGFDYPDAAHFGDIVIARDMDDMLDIVASGRADVCLINRDDFAHYTGLDPRPLELGGVNRIALLRARVHAGHPELLERINDAIATLRRNGQLPAL